MLKRPRTRFLIIRHGATEYSKESRLAGISDVPLSPEGRAQVEVLRREVDHWRLDAAVTSPLRRARETCEILMAGREVPVRVDEGLIERDYGEWEGKTFEQILSEQQDGGQSLLYGPFVARFLTGEKDQDFFQRVRKYFFDELLVRSEHQSVLVAGHAGFFMSMLAIAMGLDPVTNFAAFRLDNASLTVLDWYDGIPHLLFVNRVYGKDRTG